jgi:tetratricopeptide (TPR) repeat protein
MVTERPSKIWLGANRLTTGRKILLALLAFSLFPSPALLNAQDVAGKEILYPGDAFAKLDTFEGLNLEDADKLYVKGDFKGAYAAYKAYSFEFPKSKALPYVLLRLGRCLHKLEKRNAAITAYQDVVDYFPDDVRYAAAALYYIGECHGQNGDDAKKTATWARMVKDDDYVAQPNSGAALTYLGNAMDKLGKFEEATEYHWRTAVAFLKSNPNAAASARSAVLSYYASRRPNHEKLAEFYIAASGFDGRGQKTDNPEEDPRYWNAALETALKTDNSEMRGKAGQYWSSKMGSRFPENDDLRKLLFDAQYAHEKDLDSWVARLNKQFESKPADVDRVLQWCGYLNKRPELRSKFYEARMKPLLGGLDDKGKVRLMGKLRHPLGMHDEAQRLITSVRTDGMTDEEIKGFAELVANYEPEDTVLRYIARIKDKLFATKARFDYYNARTHKNQPNMEKALAEMPELIKSPKYADGLAYRKAELLQGLGQYEEAIKAYRAANKQPDSTFGVANCMASLERYGEAVKTVKELYSLGGGVASRAALAAANYYRTAGNKGKEVDQLRFILTNFKGSGESSEAHNRLESYGVALTGGEAEAED